MATTVTEPATGKPDLVLSTFIRCTQDALWAALTDPGQMSRWHFLANRVERAGDTYHYHRPDGQPMMTARTLQATPKSRIEATFEPLWGANIPASRTVFLISPEAQHCRLTIEHYGLSLPVVPGEGVADGWDRWIAGLKTFLETGASVRFNTAGAL